MLKITLVLMCLLPTLSFAEGVLWTCDGGSRDFQKIVIKTTRIGSLQSFESVSPDLDKESMEVLQPNDFTLTMRGVIDVVAQETIDVTIFMDEDNSALKVFTMWSTHPKISEDTLSCKIVRD